MNILPPPPPTEKKEKEKELINIEWLVYFEHMQSNLF